MPNRDELARKAQREILEHERRTAVAVVREYKSIAARLEKEINFLTGQIAAAQDEGISSVNFLLERNRLKKILDAVSREIEASSRVFGSIATGAQNAAISTAQNQLTASAELSGLKFDFDNEATRALAGQSALGSTLDNYFQRLERPLRRQFFSILTFGVATGAPSPQIAKELKDALKINASAAMTIVRTETNRVYRSASLDFYKSAKIQKYRWLAALDLNTCPICWALHGHIFTTRTPFGSHPNCRCTVVPVLPGDPAAETGAQRFAKLTIAQQMAILGKGRFELFEQGAKLSDFVQTYKSPFGLSRRLKSIGNVAFKPTGKPPAPKPPKPAPPKKEKAAAQTKPSISSIAKKINYNFKTTAEAEARFSEKYPAITFDFSKTKTEVLNDTLKEFDRLATEFPEVAARLKYVGTYKTKPVPYRENLTVDPANPGLYKKWLWFRGEMAHASTDGRRIGLNPSFYGKPEKLRETARRAKESGWLASDKTESFITHEFGHQIDHYFQTMNLKAVTEFVRADGRGMFGDIFRAWRKKYKPTAALSRYALKDRTEAFAEAFSSLNHTPAGEQDDFTKALGKFIKAFRASRFYDAAPVGTAPGKGHWKAFRDAADKDAGNAKMKDALLNFGLDFDKDF